MLIIYHYFYFFCQNNIKEYLDFYLLYVYNYFSKGVYLLEKYLIDEIIKNNSKKNAYYFTYEEKGEKVRVYDNEGFEIKPEEAVFLIEGMTNTYINMSQEEMNKLVRRNADNEFENYILHYGPYLIESDFRKNQKKDWGFTCKTCKKKVSSKNTKSWWRIDGPFHQSHDKYCSKECIQPVIDEIKDNIKSEIYQRFGAKWE